jgi:DNA-binding PadR family transcriptional regulator
MKIGKVERLVLLVLKQNSTSTNALSVLLRASGRVKTAPSVRRAVQTLRSKGFIDHSNKLTHDGMKYVKHMKGDNVVNTNELDVKIVDGLKLGTKEKILLYILTKIDHAALQFLSTIMREPVKNISAVLNRLEDNGLVYGYRNMITFTDSKGRRYRPKYYRITNTGKMISSATRSEISKMISMVDGMLEDTFKLKFEMANLGMSDKKYS